MSSEDVRPNRAHQVLDAAVYALVVTGIVSAVAVVLSAGVYPATKSFSEGVVEALFWPGWLITGYGILKLWPRAAWKSTETSEGVEIAETRVNEEETTGNREETAFQAAVQKIPPLAWYSLPPEQRLSTGTKAFLAGVTVLATSFGLDYALHW